MPERVLRQFKILSAIFCGAQSSLKRDGSHRPSRAPQCWVLWAQFFSFTGCNRKMVGLTLHKLNHRKCGKEPVAITLLGYYIKFIGIGETLILGFGL